MHWPWALNSICTYINIFCINDIHITSGMWMISGEKWLYRRLFFSYQYRHTENSVIVLLFSNQFSCLKSSPWFGLIIINFIIIVLCRNRKFINYLAACFGEFVRVVLTDGWRILPTHDHINRVDLSVQCLLSLLIAHPFSYCAVLHSWISRRGGLSPSHLPCWPFNSGQQILGTITPTHT